MWLSGKSLQLLFSASSDLVITDASRSFMGFRDVIVIMSDILMDLCLPTVETVVHNSCVLFAQLCCVSLIRLYCGFILLY